jgi:hypothetical protein
LTTVLSAVVYQHRRTRPCNEERVPGSVQGAEVGQALAEEVMRQAPAEEKMKRPVVELPVPAANI